MLIEICVDSAAGLAEAVAGGADRIELCSALALGGLTPSHGFMAHVASCDLPVLAMMRPRDGDFHWSATEVEIILNDIASARAAGLSGVVLGASLPDGRLDEPTLARMVAAAEGLDLTLHRAFDLTPDPFAAMETAITLGFSRILSSGQALRAEAGLPLLQALQRQASGRITLMPGSGITPENAGLFRAAGFGEVHASCSAVAASSEKVQAFGFAQAGSRRTDARVIRALRAACSVDQT